jgi:hypothetical protein
MVPAIGVTPHKQRPIEARVVDGGIEIDLPPDDGPKLLPAPAKMPAQYEAAATGGGARKGKGADEVFLNGITIDLTDENESITFDGETVAVSPLEAKLVQDPRAATPGAGGGRLSGRQSLGQGPAPGMPPSSCASSVPAT